MNLEGEVKAQDQADTVTYMFESLNQETVPDYKMKLMTLEQEHLSIPETDYSAIVGMPQETPKDAKLPHRLPKAAKMSEELTTEELPKIGSSVALGSFWAIHNPEAPQGTTFGTIKYGAIEYGPLDYGAKLLKEVTLSTTENKMPAIEERTDIKTRPNIKQTREDERVKTREEERVKTREEERVKTTENERVHTSGYWPPGGGPAKPQDYLLVAWWG